MLKEKISDTIIVLTLTLNLSLILIAYRLKQIAQALEGM